MRNKLSIVLALLAFQTTFAQKEAEEKKVSALHFDLNYVSNSVYQGRKDSLTIPYLSPGIRYTAASGFYASANASFLTTESRLDALMFETGYEFSKGDFDGGLGLNAYVYNPQSVNVRAETSTSLSGYAGYYLPFISPGVSAAVSIGSATDYTVGFSLEHSFSTKDERFSFTPGAYLNAGTQNYYNEYYQQRRYANGNSGKGRGKSKKGSGTTTTASTVSAQTQQSAQFKILDYELHGKLEYKVKKFAFNLIPQLAIPENPSTVIITTKGSNGSTTTQTVREKISNSFYCAVGLSYQLPLKKH